MIDQTTLPARAHDGAFRYVYGSFLARFPEKTRSQYIIHIRQWAQWCELHGLNPMTIKRGHLEAWARHLGEECDLMPRTVAIKINTVCGMYKFAAADELIDRDPGALVRRPRIQFTSTTKGLARAQFADILVTAQAESPTTHALICLLGLNGMRVGETLAADVEHLGFDRGYRTLHLPDRKGGKTATLSLAVRTTWAIEQSLNGRTSGPLLLGRDGERMSYGSVRRTVTRLCTKAGVPVKLTPHGLRHTFVTMALDANVPERDILDSTGHVSPQMLRYYDRNKGSIERNATHAVAAFVGAA